jgi:hypothetical protein
VIEFSNIYEHYKGSWYKFICIAEHSETGEELVIYADYEGKQIWARPKEMFFGQVDIGDGVFIQRFKKI